MTRSRRTAVVAAVLSAALVAPFTSPLQGGAVEASDFDTRYTTTNFWDVDHAIVQGLTLEPGDTVAATTNTIFNWTFRNAGCALVITRPQSSLSFKTGAQDIPVKVTKTDGSSFTTTLQLTIVDERESGNSFDEPGDQCPAPEEETTPSATTTPEETTSAAPVTTTETAEPSTSENPAPANPFTRRFDTANFWEQPEAVVKGLQLQPNDVVEPVTNTIFNWNFRNDDGTLTVIRPSSSTAFKSGEVDIPVKFTPAGGTTTRGTLRLNVIDEMPPFTHDVPPVETRETIDFDGARSKVVDAWDVPEGVTVAKKPGFSAIGAVGWEVAVENGKILVKAPATFTSGDEVDIPVQFSDGISTTDRTLKIRALNPQTSGKDIAGTVGSIIGALLGVGGGKGSNGLLEGLVKVEVQPSGIIVTGNANPTVSVDIHDNGSNNSVEITGNANPVVTGNLNDNGSNNSAVVTGNANPTVVITGNANPVVTGNANPVVTGNLNDNGSNNSAVVTGNANPVVTGNANPVVTGNLNDNGSNNSAVVTGNANPVVTGNLNDNGSNNSAVVTGNANPVVTGNLNDNGSNNSVEITGNANPVVTGNANGGLFGGSSKRGNNNESGTDGKEGSGNDGSSLLNANVDVAGGSSDPRCIAPLVGLGLPLVALVPVAITQQMRIPGLERIAAQAERAFNDAARGINVDPATAAAIGGGAVGVVAALLVAAAVRNCIPQVRGVDVSVGGSSGNSAAPTKDAPVVETKNV
ncbi:MULTISPECIES: hypothetical protein [Corynebacterium]|uniref:hypothetical protein n=1 Tax=Corynebacterium TaxID=1716 RepID=UPI00039C0D83|nr:MULTISPECIES: hypothetical protein [Corynebacterium]